MAALSALGTRVFKPVLNDNHQTVLIVYLCELIIILHHLINNNCCEAIIYCSIMLICSSNLSPKQYIHFLFNC